MCVGIGLAHEDEVEIVPQYAAAEGLAGIAVVAEDGLVAGVVEELIRKGIELPQKGTRGHKKFQKYSKKNLTKDVATCYRSTINIKKGVEDDSMCDEKNHRAKIPGAQSLFICSGH